MSMDQCPALDPVSYDLVLYAESHGIPWCRQVGYEDYHGFFFFGRQRWFHKPTLMLICRLLLLVISSLLLRAELQNV